MQPFTDHGNLIPGVHIYTIEEFEKQFVLDFVTSDSRKDIYYKFKQWAKQLVAIHPPEFFWMDGSFLTTKVNPKDLDLVVFYKDFPPELETARIGELINEVSRILRCDAYVAPLDDSEFSKTRQEYWLKQFGSDRDNNPKGIVQLNTDQLLRIGGENE